MIVHNINLGVCRIVVPTLDDVSPKEAAEFAMLAIGEYLEELQREENARAEGTAPRISDYLKRNIS